MSHGRHRLEGRGSTRQPSRHQPGPRLHGVVIFVKTGLTQALLNGACFCSRLSCIAGKVSCSKSQPRGTCRAQLENYASVLGNRTSAYRSGAAGRRLHGWQARYAIWHWRSSRTNSDRAPCGQSRTLNHQPETLSHQRNRVFIAKVYEVTFRFRDTLQGAGEYSCY